MDILRYKKRSLLVIGLIVLLLLIVEFFLPNFIEITIAMTYVAGFMGRSKSIWLGGIWGFVLGGILGLASGKLVGMILLPIVMTVIGVFFDYLLSKNYRQRKSMGKSTSWSQSWGAFRGEVHPVVFISEEAGRVVEAPAEGGDFRMGT